MRALIIEDSRLARQELKHLLKGFPEVTIAGEAANADEAEALIAQLKPDLLFLDIQMPGRNGFELLEALEEAPDVIFTTAYDQYAVKAFEINALDYLQKPLQPERLRAAIEKVSACRTPPARPSPGSPALTAESQVFVKDGERCWFVKLSQVRLLEIEGSYTKIHFGHHSPMIPKTLNALEARLDPQTFFRANRQQMINLKWIDQIEPWFSGGLRITLTGGETVEVSRRQANRFRELTSL